MKRGAAAGLESVTLIRSNDRDNGASIAAQTTTEAEYTPIIT